MFGAIIAVHKLVPDRRTAALEASWQAFCETENINPDSVTAADIDRYNDTWRGSSDEELALLFRDINPDDLYAPEQ